MNRKGRTMIDIPGIMLNNVKNPIRRMINTELV